MSLDPLGALLTGGIGLVAGVVGGVLSAAPIARFSARSRERYNDKKVIHERVRQYLATIRYDDAMLPRRSFLPATYADYKGQYELTLAVLQDSVRLRDSDRKKPRADLLLLVGSTTLTDCERLVDVPRDRVDHELVEKDRALNQIIAVQHPDDHDKAAYLRRLVHNHFDDQARALATTTLDRMLKVTAP